jgi:predicted aspartyl protease
VKRSNKIKILGVTVIELKIWETFRSNGHTITKVINADGGKKNFSVAVSMSKGVPKKSLGTQQFCKRGSSCVSGRTAVASIVWEGTAVVSVGTIEVDKKQTLTSNVYGTASSSLKNV